MKTLFNVPPKKHRLVLILIDLAITIAVFSQVPLIVEIVREFAGGFGPVLNCLVIGTYILSFLFILAVSTFIVGIFYAVLTSFGLFGDK